MSVKDAAEDAPLQPRGRANYFERVAAFWSSVRAELRRTTWPTLKEVQNTTLITIIAVVFFAVYLFLVDQLWALILNGVTSLFK